MTDTELKEQTAYQKGFINGHNMAVEIAEKTLLEVKVKEGATWYCIIAIGYEKERLKELVR